MGKLLSRIIGIIGVLIVINGMCPAPSCAMEPIVDPSLAWYDLGVYAYEKKDLDTAKQSFLKTLEKNPDNEYCLHYLGKIDFINKQYTGARQYFEKAWQANPAIPGLAFDLAMLYFQTGDYTLSFEVFDALVSDTPDTALARYYAGMSLYRKQEFSSALPYLLAAADQNPSIKPSCFYYAGICYKYQGKPDLAREKFEYIQNHAQSSLLTDNATRQLSLLREKDASKKPYSLDIRTGVSFDDNVACAPDETDFYSDEGDTVIDVYLSGNYTIINQGPYRLDAGLSYYQTMHSDLKEYDMSATVLTLHGYRFFQGFGFGLTYTPTVYRLDGDSFLTRNTLETAATIPITKGLLANITYDYTDNAYDNHTEKDGNSQEGALGIYYRPGGPITALSVRIGYESTRADGSDYSFSRIKTRIKFSVVAPWGLNCDITGQYQLKDYDNDDSYYETKREDKWFSGGLSISKPVFFDWMRVSAEFRHEGNTSTIDPFNYHKNVTGVFLGARF